MAEVEGPASEPGDEWRRFLRSLLPAAILFAILFGGLVGFARTWPPIVAVESDSMAHSDTESAIGAMDTGDLIVVEAIAFREHVVTYLEGRASGRSTYGDFGDVIVFIAPGDPNRPPFIHRALAYIYWNESVAAYDVPDLAALPDADWDAWDAAGVPTNETSALSRFVLHRAGWRRDIDLNANLTMGVDPLLVGTQRDGFLTMGDNSYTLPRKVDGWIIPLSAVLGKARGEIPWFGLVRLTLFPGESACCESWGSTDTIRGAPANSWLALNLSLTAIIGSIAAFVTFDTYVRRHPESWERVRRSWQRLNPWRGKQRPDDGKPPDGGAD